jgi:hypothetical protein
MVTVIVGPGLNTDTRMVGGPSPVRLDPEQRSWVTDCLAKSGLGAALAPRLIDLIDHSIAIFLAARACPPGTDREVHDALRKLWLLAHEEDPPVKILRGRIARVPPKALSYIGSRAIHLIPRLFPGQSMDPDFVTWAANASGPDLVKAMRTLAANGGRVVPGRSRGGGKRSKSKLEPVIGGQVRGIAETAPSGGRPPHADQDTLVMHLAIDWYRATDQPPEDGRSDATGFGELVHSVFDWLCEPGATQALRRYWREVNSAKKTKVSGRQEIR